MLRLGLGLNKVKNRNMGVRGAGGGIPTYEEMVLSTDPDSIVGYWPLSDESGSTAVDVKNALNGTYSNFTLNQTVIDVNGKKITAPTTTNTAAYLALPALTGWDGQEGAVMGWFRVNGAANWATGTRYFWWLRADNNNYIRAYQNGDRTIIFDYKAGGTTVTYTATNVYHADWFHVAMVWSKAGDYVKIYINGVLLTTLTGLGTWAGTPGVSNRNIGQFAVASTNAWRGAMAHIQIRNAPLSGTLITQLASKNHFETGVTTSILYVSKTGNDTTGDGTQANPVLTIAQANVLAAADETKERITIGAGTYAETITPPHGYLEYRAEGVVVVSGGAGNGLEVNYDNLTSEGIDYETCSYGVHQDTGAILDNTVINDATISNCTNEGVYIKRSTLLAMDTVTVTACGGQAGIKLELSSGYALTNCVCHHTDVRGFNLYSNSDSGTLTDCVAYNISGAGYGFENEVGSDNIIYTRCEAYNCIQGFIDKDSTGVQYLDCVAHDNSSTGFYAKNGDTVIYDGCTTADADFGVLIDDNDSANATVNATVQNCIISDSGVGITVQNGSTLLLSDYNTFSGNTNVGDWQGAPCATLAAWQTASGQDAHSSSI